MPHNQTTKRRYNDPSHPQFRELMQLRRLRAGSGVFHHVLNLFLAHRREREHRSGRVLQTARYRAWIARRDTQ